MQGQLEPLAGRSSSEADYWPSAALGYENRVMPGESFIQSVGCFISYLVGRRFLDSEGGHYSVVGYNDG